MVDLWRRPQRKARTQSAGRHRRGAPKPSPGWRCRPAARSGTRAKRSAERRDAILAAALDEFAARGFAATRLDDVAKRADVAKGTIYLHFADKETLFQELIRLELEPRGRRAGARLARRHSAPASDRPIDRGVRPRDFRDAAQGRHPARPHRGPALPQARRILLSRGDRRGRWKRSAPCCAAPYERGELKTDALVRFPQLLPAPGIVAIIWSGLFDRFEPLDVRAMMRAHFDVLFGHRSAA